MTHRAVVPEPLEREREELLEYWRKLLARRPTLLEHRRTDLDQLLNPATFASSMNFRKVHDMLGWQAKDHRNCAGAIYRSHDFMKSAPGDRCGSRKPCANHRAPVRIHIEHTVQAAALRNAWNSLAGQGARPSDAAAIDWILKQSVATAMCKAESARLPTLLRIPDRPFDRYLEAVKLSTIWNLVHRTEVDPAAFTFEDHGRTVDRLLEEARSP